MNNNSGKYLWWTIILTLIVIVFAFNGIEENGLYLLLAILFFPATCLLLSLIFRSKKQDSNYEQEKYKYEESKKAPPTWMPYSQSTNTINSLPSKREDQTTWKCNNCGEINSISVYFCQSCGEYKK